ncbi:hypothetical protein P8605_27710 [Streptomyces sp. T-3]|nr:hypothetical protein [Streptomyces sp. T-3]
MKNHKDKTKKRQSSPQSSGIVKRLVPLGESLVVAVVALPDGTEESAYLPEPDPRRPQKVHPGSAVWLRTSHKLVEGRPMRRALPRRGAPPVMDATPPDRLKKP